MGMSLLTAASYGLRCTTHQDDEDCDQTRLIRKVIRVSPGKLKQRHVVRGLSDARSFCLVSFKQCGYVQEAFF